ncbi:phosphoribosylamine--glycine ligase [Bdellovibrio bacteriovorus]
MKVVVVGKGGREHALAQKIKESNLLSELWVCPGNPGMARAGINCAPVETADAIEAFCLENKVSLVIIGPEALILSDLKARLEMQGIPCFAPTKNVAQLESSKLFCKNILHDAGVPTAQVLVTHDLNEAKAAIEAHDFTSPLVLKADGLAAGKGVWVCENKAHALEGLLSLTTQFGFPLLIEECLIGKELSAFALCDGKDFVILGTACDYKRITPDLFSANTGGMGAFSPCDFITKEDAETIHQIFDKTLNSLHEKNLSYQGFLFAGLMKTAKGLYVLEYNVRMGDPETQALMPRIQSDLLELISAATRHELATKNCKLSEKVSVHVVAVSKGYPEANMLLGAELNLPPKLNTQLYFAGVSEKNQKLVNSGGRVLGVTALASSKESARMQAYEDIQKIAYEGMYFRKDIGQ